MMFYSSLEKCNSLDDKMLGDINGGGYGAQCVIGTAGSTILGAAFFGPAGATAGITAGSTFFCYGTVR